MSVEARPRAIPAILNAGLLAGLLDITAAMTQAFLKGRPPLRVLQAVAAGWLGRQSFQLGAWSMALGFATHFLIATIWAAIFWAASRRLRFLVRHAALCGALYGVFVYFFMQQVVIPLSAIHRRPQTSTQDLITGLLIHITCVGWPIAFVTRAHVPRRDTSTI